ncbi:cytosine deaminase [Devosia nitrariae]|uniref:Amidohydrolase n=1 Tax=Devosia nitrariae TaxID=2071872 RepID=A0ABQ5W4G9_9HYPH|nr:cytosine deaminase [Devosia nitrariae]GLQ54701.1 amidohydrolase [Devosia nitrariae]
MKDRVFIADSYVLANAGVPLAFMDQPTAGDIGRFDITVTDGIIAAIGPTGSADPSLPRQNLDAGLILPCFTDLHTHIDKGHIWPRRANPDGTWIGALQAVMEDRQANWAGADVKKRMDFSLRCAYAHGTAAIRTHLDSAQGQHAITWDIFEEARESWAGRIELQAVALTGPDTILDKPALRSIALRVKAGKGILGGSTAVHPDNPHIMRSLVDMAGELGLDLDLHIDETGDPAADALKCFADAVIETGFTGRVIAGHCCALAQQDTATAMATIERVAEAGIAVVSLPMCNMYLQDRSNDAATPRWRGVTLLNELKAAGVPVAIASDNTRDPFYAYGDLDGMEVLREGARIIQFDHPQDGAWPWARTIGAAPSQIAGFAHTATIAPGLPADFILVRARSWSELMARPQSDRVVIRAGKAIDTTLPDYRELDDLMGAA